RTSTYAVSTPITVLMTVITAAVHSVSTSAAHAAGRLMSLHNPPSPPLKPSVTTAASGKSSITVKYVSAITRRPHLPHTREPCRTGLDAASGLAAIVSILTDILHHPRKTDCTRREGSATFPPQNPSS